MILRLGIVASLFLLCFGVASLRQRIRKHRYERGTRLNSGGASNKISHGLHWGNRLVAPDKATQHFLAVGTTGSGKSLVQRMLMKDVLPQIVPASDSRCLIFDAKNDIVPFLKQVGTSCSVFSLNPFESRDEMPVSVRWDIASDITSPARAMNLAASLVPSERSGGNQYFTDAARQVISGVIESMIRHSPGKWTFSDFVYATLSMDRLRRVLNRDALGKDVLSNFFGDERTAYQVFTTVASRMNYFRPVAALWQNRLESLSIRDWLLSESVLLLGMNASCQTALDAINEIIFRVVVEEVDAQSDSHRRRTWIWIDEARLSGPILRGPLLPYLAVKGRSRGACLVLAFQDIEGFREAAGVRIANEIIAQCSHKALLRLESDESAAWASRMVGQYETLDRLYSSPSFLSRGGSSNEQVARRDAIMASEFYAIPPTSVSKGLHGFFITASDGASRMTVPGCRLKQVFVHPELELACAFVPRSESDQWLRSWSSHDEERLALRQEANRTNQRSGQLRLGRKTEERDLATDLKPEFSNRLSETSTANDSQMYSRVPTF